MAEDNFSAKPNAEQVARFDEFFDRHYQRQLKKLLEKYPDEKSLDVDFDALTRFDPSLADKLLEEPDAMIACAAEAVAQRREATAVEGVEFKPNVRVFNLPEACRVQVLELGAAQIDKLYGIEGVVSSISEIKPRVIKAVWRCKHCDADNVLYTQKTEPVSPPFACANPACGRGNFEMRENASTFVNMQRAQMQDPVEKMRGNMPSVNAELWLEDDLVNKIAPGDKIVVTGMLRLKPVQQGKGRSSVYAKFFEVNHIHEIELDFEELEVTREEEAEILKLSQDPRLRDKIIASIAPSVWGYTELKLAITLQLFGGTPGKIQPDGKHIRSDMHVLMIGDPGCLTGDALVPLGNGALCRISELGERHLQEIRQPLLTGQGHKRALAVKFHRYPLQPVIEVTMESGKRITGTHNHPLLAVKGMETAWKRLDEIKPGDKLATAGWLPCTVTKDVPTMWKAVERKFSPHSRCRLPQRLTPQLAGLLGYVQGDGWVTRTRVAMDVNLEEEDLLPLLTKIIAGEFGVTPKESLRKPKNRKPIHILELHSVDAAGSLQFLKSKRVPSLVLRSGNKHAAEYLAWLFEADGSVFSKGRGRRAVQLKSSAPELLRDVQTLLLRFAIHSRINTGNLAIRRAESIRKFANKVGFKSAKKRSRIERLVKDCSSLHHERGGQRSERVVSVRPAGVADVFDVEVPDGHRFIANGIISHNTAKSTVLEYVRDLAPKCIIVSGGGVSGVGLTASAEKDAITEGWVLKAGAMVLANGGLVGIDEMDKMDEEDRGAIHQAMEQQRISIAKAGIVTEFRTKTAVLGAANPKMGRFDPNTPIASQFALSPALLSRFDLIFPMKDVLDESRDRQVAEHILEGHRYAAAHGKPQGASPIVPVVRADLLRKYIAYARRNVTPELTVEAANKVKEYYVELRKMGKEQNTFPITARQIEGLIRLSEAHAKMRLSQLVETQDAQSAIDLLDFVLRGVFFDRETGRIDSDIIAIGQPKSKLDKIRSVLGLISSLEKEMDLVAEDDVVREAASLGMDEAYARKLVDDLKRQGDLYSPKPGYLKQARSREY